MHLRKFGRFRGHLTTSSHPTPILSHSSPPRTPVGIEEHSEEELVDLLSKVKSARQTQALRARLPAPLAPFASNIAVTEPVKEISMTKEDGLYCSSFGVKECQIRMAVTVVPSLGSPSEDEVKVLKLIWSNWWTEVKYATGSAYSSLNSIYLNYDYPNLSPITHSPSEWPPRSIGQAYTAEYYDPGIVRYEHAHGGVKDYVKQVVRDLGFLGGEIDELGVIEALIGGDAGGLLDRSTVEGLTLRKVIDDGLEEQSNGIW